MSIFLDCRMAAVGGELSTLVAVNQGTSIDDYAGLAMSDLLDAIRGRHVLIGTHGFNVNRSDGIDCLSNWESLLELPPASGFVGLLWPGDSIWAHGLDYPEEPKLADDAGVLMASFLDTTFGGAASISFASHSLGARVVLSTITHMSLPVRRLILMAGAVDDDCLTNEFAAAAAKVGQISILASMKDEVLSAAFPMGNFISGIIAAGHPWWHAAIGHCGPVAAWPENFRPPYAIPENWKYQHGNYLKIDDEPAPALAIPTDVPPDGSPVLSPDIDPEGNEIAGWQESFSAAFASTRFR